ncbi:MAG: iron-containing alcohol dehydrogenase family protein [Halobacteriota archaeon]
MDADDERGGGSPFRFDYHAPVITYGTGAVDGLAAELDEHGLERALVVCGSTVGTTPEVIDPVTEGLGDRLGGVFAETTPEKRLDTVYDGIEEMRRVDADVLVSLGGGSSLDAAKFMSVLAASDRSPEAVGRGLVESGSVTVPEGSLTPIVAIPTTLAGAELSMGGSVTASPASGLVDEPAVGGAADPRLMATAVFYDPAIFATTPEAILTASAMNGFDKGIETLYSRHSTAITDATAMRGLGLYQDGLTALADDSTDFEAIQRVVEGSILVQYGIARPGVLTLSIIHAFGHGLTRNYEVQQGAAHAIVAPHVLRYVFEEADARRDLLAESLGVDAAPDPADAVVAAVEALVEALELPRRLRDVDGPDRAEFADVAEAIVDDWFVDNGPSELDPTVEDVTAVLRAAW